MEIEIININHNGEGIGRILGKVIFVPKTVKGDIVKVLDIRDYGNYFRGRVDEFIKYSKDRVNIRCPYYDRCGGCHIMGISYDMQLEYKRDKVINIFKKYCDMDINPIICSSVDYGYRNKIIFQVKGGRIGFFEYNSNNFVEVNKCLLVSKRMNKVIDIIKRNVILGNVNKIMLRDSLDGVMLFFYGDVSDIDVNLFSKYVCSIYVNDEKIYGVDNILLGLDRYKYVVSKDSFFQVNLEIALRLYSYVKDSIKDGSRVLDLYCGVGSIGIFCADKCREVFGVEINKESIDNANVNKDINGIDNIKFMCLNVNKLSCDSYYDTLIIDPPRGGLDSKTIDFISNSGCNDIIYISCNPITLVRDINRLSKYIVSDVRVFDMFPNTYHVECVSVLSRKAQ